MFRLVLTISGLALLLVGTFGGWVHAPILGNRGETGVALLAFFLTATTIAATLRRSPRLLLWSSTGALLLSLLFLFHLTLFDPQFWDLIEENYQYGAITDFSRTAFLPNLGEDASFSSTLAIDSFFSRLLTAGHFLSKAWAVFLFGALLNLSLSLFPGVQKRPAAKEILLVALFFALPLLFFTGEGLFAQLSRNQGDSAIARGDYAEAVTLFRRSQIVDPQLLNGEALYLRIGEARLFAGENDSPETLLFLGSLKERKRQIDDAILYYRNARLTSDPALKALLKKRIGRNYAKLGFLQYRGGNLGAAQFAWERSMEINGWQFPVVYFLAKAYYDSGRYHDSLRLNRYLRQACRNPLLNALLEANIGDALWQLGDQDEARLAYEQSMKFDSTLNLRGIRSLGGT